MRRYVSAAAIAAALLLIIGCATSKPAGSVASPPAATVAGPRPTPADSGGSQATDTLTPEEKALLGTDQTWDEEPQERETAVADPLEPVNRAVFAFNDKLMLWVMIPVAKGYAKVVEPQIRSGISNFFFNLAAPIRILNNILQGKPRAAEAEVTRFFYNTTVGVLGFGNPAKNNPGLNPDPEDLGQTLGRYGVGNGFYLVLPVLGPSTLRDTAGLTGDHWINPVSYVQPFEASFSLSAYKTLNNLSFHTEDYITLKNSALDPYTAFRNAYIQLRQSRIRR